MHRDYPNLCKPIKIGNLTLRNRMASAPMGATDILADGCKTRLPDLCFG